MCCNYVFKRENNLSRSAKVKEKRSPSPLNRDVSHSFKNSLNVQLNKRKSSTSSSSNCDDEFERDDESGKLTNCTSKNQYSHISSTELEKCNGYCVSPFDNVIEADSDKESSPLPSRINDRKNSLMDDLDILSKCLPTVNLMRANSGVVENIESSKANKSKLRLRHCEIVECHKEDY